MDKGMEKIQHLQMMFPLYTIINYMYIYIDSENISFYDRKSPSQPCLMTLCRGCHPLLEVQKRHVSGAKRDQGCALGTVNAIWLVVTGT